MELAGFVGIDPRPFTLRELAQMAKGRAVGSWDHTSHILWMIANVNRDPKRRAHPIEDFHPFKKRKKRRGMSPERLRGMKSFFSKGEK